jgi:hypothetical protein
LFSAKDALREICAYGETPRQGTMLGQVMAELATDLGLAHLRAMAKGTDSRAIEWTATHFDASRRQALGVDGCCEIRALIHDATTTEPVRFAVTLEAVSYPARFEPAHGQWLYAAEGRIGSGTIAFGTSDAEWLSKHGAMPAAMLSSDVADGRVTLSVTLPQAVVTQGQTLRFAVAWVNDWAGKPDLEVAPWLALSAALELPEIPS